MKDKVKIFEFLIYFLGIFILEIVVIGIPVYLIICFINWQFVDVDLMILRCWFLVSILSSIIGAIKLIKEDEEHDK